MRSFSATFRPKSIGRYVSSSEIATSSAILTRPICMTAAPIGTAVMQIRRVRMADDVAISLDETYLPLDLGRKVVENDLTVYPIFSLLEGKYDTPLLEADYRLEAISADPRVAEALGIEVNSPILLIERVSYSLDQRPVDYEKLFYRGDRIRLSTRLRRRQSPLPLEVLPRIAPKSQ